MLINIEIIALKIEPLRILFELLNFGVKSLQLHVVFNAGFARIMEPTLKKIVRKGVSLSQ